jgi:hypothetical protein
VALRFAAKRRDGSANEPVKLVTITGAFEPAARLQNAYNSYANFHIKRIAGQDAIAIGRNNRRPEAPAQMRSTGLGAADWAVITEYIDLLRPPKEATKHFEGRGKSGKYGAIFEGIPVFEYLFSELESRFNPYEHIDFNAHREAPEDHVAINVRAA